MFPIISSLRLSVLRANQLLPSGGGGWAFGLGPQDDAESIAAIRRAVDLGINWIDAAPLCVSDIPKR